MSTSSRRRTFSGAPWEAEVGYCRALRSGNTVVVTGTAPVGDDGEVVAPGDAYAQTQRCFALIERALHDLDADLRHVVRTRMFVTDISRWREFGRAHKEAFGDAPPATTMVEVQALIDPAMLIEIEVDAIVDDDDQAIKPGRR
jgi:enamine deaminase RidA (YjgF/YER057c/UK114 family)